MLESPFVPRLLPAPLLIGAAFAVIYGATAASTAQGFDSGELIAVADGWGVAHPPGFPTFTILTALWTDLVPLPADHALSLWSALAGATACGLLVAVMTRLGVGTLPASISAAVWGLMPSAWMLHTSQEIFATAHAALALLLFLYLPERPRNRASRSYLHTYFLGTAFGLATGVHTLLVWFAPIAAHHLWISAKDLRDRIRQFSLWLLGAATGALVFLYPLAGWQGEGLEWRDGGGFMAAVAHALRLDYGVLSLGVKPGPFGFALREYAEHVFVNGGPWILLAVVGWIVALRPRSGSVEPPPPSHGAPITSLRLSRGRAAAVLAAHLSSSLLFFGLFRLPETTWSEAVVSRFFPQADLYGAVFVGLALHAGFHAARRPVSYGSHALAAALLVYVPVTALPHGPSIGRTGIEDHARAALDSIAPEGVLIGTGDSFIGAVWERQYVHAQRRDVTFVVSSLLPAPWYAERIRQRTGYAHPERMKGISRLIGFLHDAGVPVYTAEPPKEPVRQRFHFVPEGVVLRVLPSNTKPPPAPWVEAREAAFFERHPVPQLFDWQDIRTEERLSLDAFLLPWRTLCKIYERANDTKRLARCRQRLDRLASRMLPNQ